MGGAALVAGSRAVKLVEFPTEDPLMPQRDPSGLPSVSIEDDLRDDESPEENEIPVRETDEATEAPEEFELDDEDDSEPGIVAEDESTADPVDDELEDEELAEDELEEDELEDEEEDDEDDGDLEDEDEDDDLDDEEIDEKE
jgi:segregation and condensation protein B